MIALLTACPSVGVPCLSASLFDSEVSIGQKRVLLVWLRAMAITMSQHAYADPKAASSPRMVIDTAAMDPKALSGLFKPLTFQARQKAKSLVNSFHQVAPEVFYPIANFLSLQLKESNQGVDLQGIDVILPAEALLTLCSVLQCAVYTVHLRKFSLLALELANQFRRYRDISLQRAALSLLYLSIDCATHHQKAVQDGWNPGAPRRVDAMDALLHISADMSATDEMATIQDGKPVQ